jgi:hypothetical protein
VNRLSLRHTVAMLFFRLHSKVIYFSKICHQPNVHKLPLNCASVLKFILSPCSYCWYHRVKNCSNAVTSSDMTFKHFHDHLKCVLLMSVLESEYGQTNGSRVVTRKSYLLCWKIPINETFSGTKLIDDSSSTFLHIWKVLGLNFCQVIGSFDCDFSCFISQLLK